MTLARDSNLEQRLVREWKGKVHEVTITSDGFEYQAEAYKSLSPIGCRITGTRWSRPRLLRYQTREEGPMKPNSRCAIYTRKSSEEGLEQSFNSLHAQREACEAYVFSQKHEGWHALSAKYDDGGFRAATWSALA